MSDDDLLASALTKEKSLWSIYQQARRIPANKFNFWTTSAIVVIAIVTCWLSPQPISDTTAFVRSAATLGLSITLSVLGFLVAGFTIFATISNPNMLVKMAGKRHPESGLSWLKHVFFTIIRVFIYYLSYAFFCFVIIYLAAPGGIVTILLKFSIYEAELRFGLVKLGYIALISGQYFLLMQLKSFVFNIYHVVVSAVRWRAEGND